MQITDFIICDDIRFEEGGKRSLMGVVEDTMQIIEQNKHHKWPKQISLGVMIRVMLDKEQITEKPSTCELFLQISDERKSLGVAKLPPPPVNNPEKSKLALAIVVKNLPVNKPGKITGIIVLRDKEGKTIAEQETMSNVKLQVKVLEPPEEQLDEK